MQQAKEARGCGNTWRILVNMEDTRQHLQLIFLCNDENNSELLINLSIYSNSNNNDNDYVYIYMFCQQENIGGIHGNSAYCPLVIF